MTMNTEDFLWYSAFGITKTAAKKSKDNALSTCMDKAYADFRRTINYKYSNSELEKLSENEKVKIDKKNFKDEKRDFIRETKKVISVGVSNIIKLGQANLEASVDMQKEFDQIHKKTCDGICAENDALKTRLTYGQAQKWLNMTLKYMVIMDLWDELEAVKIYLHAPLDNYIFKAISVFEPKCISQSGAKDGGQIQYQVWYNVKSATKELIEPDKKINTAEGRVKSVWSKIGYQVYQNIQKMIVDNIGDECRYDWECRKWLEEA